MIRGTTIRQIGFAAAAWLLMVAPAAMAQATQNQLPASLADTPETYADLVGLADASKLVVRVRIKKQATLAPERAPGLKPGYARLYIEAETESLLFASAPIGAKLSYLVDAPLNAKGKPPKLKKSSAIVFARAVPNRPGEIQLVAPDAQLPATTLLEQRLNPILRALAAPDSPPHILGIRDALPVFGNLSGESETQIFLETATGAPGSITVIRRPGMAPAWGVSWSEIVDQSVRAPQPNTIAWYRLACFLPRRLPGGAILADSRDARRLAKGDYALVLHALGRCPRKRG